MAHRIVDHDAHHHEPFEVHDVQALLRLCNALHEDADVKDDDDAAGDGNGRKRKLLHALRQMIDADRASASVVSFADPDVTVGGQRGGARSRAGASGNGTGEERKDEGATELVSVVHAGPTAPGGAGKATSTANGGGGGEPHDPSPWHAYHARRLTPPRAGKRRGEAGAADLVARAWCVVASATPHGVPAARRRRPARAGQFVHSFLPLAGDDRVVACLTVGRNPGRPRFTSRDRSIVCTLHPAVAWIYRADVVLVSPEARRLPHRVRETLKHLLAGKCEKQIAAAMGLSYNTIHHYVKKLHRHFDVSTRSELLARWRSP